MAFFKNRLEAENFARSHVGRKCTIDGRTDLYIIAGYSSVFSRVYAVKDVPGNTPPDPGYLNFNNRQYILPNISQEQLEITCNINSPDSVTFVGAHQLARQMLGGKKKMIPDFPHLCPACRRPAYIGFSTVEHEGGRPCVPLHKVVSA